MSKLLDGGISIVSEQNSATRAWMSGMGRKLRAVKEKVIPSPEPREPKATPGMLGTGAASNAANAARDAAARREREAGL